VIGWLPWQGWQGADCEKKLIEERKRAVEQRLIFFLRDFSHTFCVLSRTLTVNDLFSATPLIGTLPSLEHVQMSQRRLELLQVRNIVSDRQLVGLT
jgi:hypothetical protein